MKRALPRSPAAVLLTAALLLTGACESSQSGSSNPDNQTDQAPGQDAEEPEDIAPS